MEEVWKPLPRNGFEEYEVSNMGRVRHQNRILATYKDKYKNNRVQIKLYCQGEHKAFEVQRLVGESFVERLEAQDRYIQHKNRDLSDNRASNLFWYHKTIYD